MQKIVSANTPLEYQFQSGQDYTIEGYLDGRPLNTLFISHFSGSEHGIELI